MFKHLDVQHLESPTAPNAVLRSDCGRSSLWERVLDAHRTPGASASVAIVRNYGSIPRSSRPVCIAPSSVSSTDTDPAIVRASLQDLARARGRGRPKESTNTVSLKYCYNTKPAALGN